MTDAEAAYRDYVRRMLAFGETVPQWAELTPDTRAGIIAEYQQAPRLNLFMGAELTDAAVPMVPSPRSPDFP